MAQLRMNITINIQFSANVLLLTIFALFAYSCTKENETTGARIYEGETGQTHYIFYYILLFRFFIILLVITILPFVYVDYFSYLYKIY